MGKTRPHKLINLGLLAYSGLFGSQTLHPLFKMTSKILPNPHQYLEADDRCNRQLIGSEIGNLRRTR